MSELIIYEDHDRGVEIRLEGETLWLNLNQIAGLFGVNKPAISKHLKNIYKTGELDREATVSKMETVQEEGGRRVRRQIDYYNLDAVLSVGYRVNSSLATRFRIWATSVLKDHLTQGWTLNRQRLESNAQELETALRLVCKILNRFRARVNLSYKIPTTFPRNTLSSASSFARLVLWSRLVKSSTLYPRCSQRDISINVRCLVGAAERQGLDRGLLDPFQVALVPDFPGCLLAIRPSSTIWLRDPVYQLSDFPIADLLLKLVTGIATVLE